MYRALVYNIAYATGAPGSHTENLLRLHRYFLKKSYCNLNEISKFISNTDPDIIGLLEVDTGSFRASKINQVSAISSITDYYTHYTTKYGDSLTSKIIPILRKQGNAILTKEKESNGIYHYFPGGFKKLILELDMNGLRFFLVHLSLSERVRTIQLKHISNLLATNKSPVIVAGDFNAFKGINELEEIQKRLNLINPNTYHKPTFPAWNPKHQIDFLLCSKDIKIINFDIPSIMLSDHLPIILDFEL